MSMCRGFHLLLLLFLAILLLPQLMFLWTLNPKSPKKPSTHSDSYQRTLQDRHLFG